MILDLLKNREIVIAHAEEATEALNINDHLNKINNIEVKNTLTEQLIGGLQIATMGAGLIIITTLSAVDLSNDVISLGELVQINAYVLQFVLPVSYFGLVMSSIKKASVTLEENSNYLLPLPYRRKQPPTPSLHSAPPSIRFENVSVKGADNSLILRNISFELSAGNSIAIVGNSGSGKSTLIKSLIGLLDIHSGQVYINSKKLCEEQITFLRPSLGYAPQEQLLLSRTIRRNVLPSPHLNEINAKHFYYSSGMPTAHLQDGTEHTLEGLSGGERQRISLARAIARNPKILVLDEPTSSLDVITRRAVNDYIFNTQNFNTTRIIVTHDMETASLADVILVLKDGAVSEFGPPEKILSPGGYYFEQLVHGDEH
ncbi:ATP-binding cassette domain-containing protein [Pseudomonas cedrina]|uniref:ATP-binding cassette domain-containing protein n=1 Tax=Pseudomonas cedrina TaxID=651740 RepID=UPI00278641E5|nr:ABC transporter ATP-binding protein [Pseudomonas cedrina]MDQ0654018.1 ABC-type bacteriocin/lantibiotic exporter with double-glycine peptidase domain [Pseudomonas cedrina]